jgi:hypothetical protein
LNDKKNFYKNLLEIKEEDHDKMEDDSRLQLSETTEKYEKEKARREDQDNDLQKHEMLWNNVHQEHDKKT